MPILSGDIKLIKSEVMADVPEGGGGPTSQVIADGVSNAIFPDISSVDRAGGDVAMRKVHAVVQTDDVDTFFGANLIIAEPPQDPNVSVTIFSTGETFDRRTDAQSRVESYLALGSRYSGLLFGTHLTGMMTVSLIQQQDRPLPAIGTVLVLLKNAGLVSEVQQYVRITAVSSAILTFTDGSGDFQRRVVTCNISDPLRYDFPGFDAVRQDASVSYTGKTETYQTIVANAARYYGVKPLAQAASIGAYTVQVGTPYSSLIPSAQVETPIADARTNSKSAMLVSTGSPVVLSTVRVLPTQNVFIGGAVLPGSFTAVAGSVTITDENGRLMVAGTAIGRIDYENGTLTADTDVFGGAGTMTVTYTPAASPLTVQKSQGIPITISNRSLSYVVTLGSNVARASVMVSYLAMGSWYVLRDEGGAVRGTDTAYGVGTINYTTNTLTLTLGALPDVGSSIIIQWAVDAATVPAADITLRNGSKLYADISIGEAIAPNTLTMTWAHGGTKTATDDGAGQLTGDASGTVDYKAGRVVFTPTTLPPVGTVVNMTPTSTTHVVNTNVVHVYATAGSGVHLLGTLGSFSEPNTVRFSYRARVYPFVSYPSTSNPFVADVNASKIMSLLLEDNGAGALLHAGSTVGTINYVTGAFDITIYPSDLGAINFIEPTRILGVSGWAEVGLIYEKGTASGCSLLKAESEGGGLSVTFATTPSAPKTLSHTLTSFVCEPEYQPEGHALNGVSFNLGSDRFVSTAVGALIKNPDSASGVGVNVGSVSAESGRFALSAWSVGTTPEITNFSGVQSPPSEGSGSLAVDAIVTFRTASAPLRPSSFQLIGVMQDGTSINVTANSNGEINASRVKGKVDVDTGVVRLYFCNPSATSYGTADASSLGISGVGTVNVDIVRPDTLRYNAVAYTYLPLDANLLGIDPVRLPSDGRVPIYRAGGFVVVGHTGRITASVSNGQTINCARVRLSRVRVVGNDGIVINTGYTTDLDAGTVTFTNVTGYSQPVTVEHRIEDMALVRDVQISGAISLTRPLTHDYPIAGVGEQGAFVSSALVHGDVFARVSSVYDQQTWTGVWSDDLIGSATTATFNHSLYPITVTNRGAVSERWMIRFTNTTAFEIVGEHVGVIATGNTATDCAPNNPATGMPYFTIPALGWGAGWAAGNILRVNTVGAQVPVWVVRTVQQGPETVPDDNFTLLIRGDVDRP